MEAALLGGTFDPPHMGHVLLCASALALTEIDQVWWVPTAVHAFGKRPSPLDQRMAWCRAAIAPFGERARVVAPPEGEGEVSYTVEQLEALEAAHPGLRLRFLAGADVAQALPHFHRSSELLQRWGIDLVGRSSLDLPALDARDLRVLPTTLPPISSSEIRQLRNAGESIQALVPLEVLKLLPKRFCP